MAKFKAGDKVRILDVSYIGGADAYFKNGDTTHAISVDHGGNPYLYCNDGDYDDGLYITDRELDYLELITETYRAEKRKANVGERILITNATISCGNYKNGDVLTVGGYYEDSARHAVKSTVPDMISINHDEYEVIIGAKPSKNERISLLESQVAELQAEVQALKFSKQAVGAGATIRETLAKLAKEYTDSIPKMITPNEQRKAVIDRAKYFVAIQEPLTGRRVEYVVNAEKRTVVALIYRIAFRGERNGLYAKAIAKCAPDDVFNADIGKAIALGRALGLDVSEFENAVKPTEVVAGHITEILHYGTRDKTGELCEVVAINSQGYPKYGDGMHASDYEIIDDTEAQY